VPVHPLKTSLSLVGRLPFDLPHDGLPAIPEGIRVLSRASACPQCDESASDSIIVLNGGACSWPVGVLGEPISANL
jgi:hypothetical protein